MIALTDIGSFYVGGRALTVSGRPKTRVTYSAGFADVPYDPNGHFWIEQAYVQYFLPTRPRFQTPVLLVHGGGLTGAIWETKPDGAPGWLAYFLRAGIATYVIDNAERGRAGFCSHDGVWPGAPITRSGEESWSLYRIGDAANFDARIPFAGQQFPIEAWDGLAKLTVARWPANGPVLLAGLEAAIERIGPCVVIGHSQGGGLALSAALALPDIVRACVLLEPHGIPTAMEKSAVRGRGSLLVMGDYLSLVPEWRDLSSKAHSAQQLWQESSGVAETLALPERGISGNSHMPMMDRNSDVVAEHIVEWLDRQNKDRKLP